MANEAVRYERTRATTVAGLCYLSVIAGGLFAEGVVRQSLIVPGDAESTARAVLANPLLWRMGIAVHLMYLVPALTMKVIVSGFFRGAEPILARLALVFGIVAVTIEAVSLLQLYMPIALVEHGVALASSRDASTLIYLGTQLFSAGFAFSLFLFAGFCAAIGVLILRTLRMPRAIGWMMLLAGGCYFTNTLAKVVSPNTYNLINPGILLPIFLAEFTLALWLLTRGIVRERDAPARFSA